ncbi:hypothetical protein HY449_02870 [Candidatus Pacearchaeota archaeon]|nr:hypothetical protein [Candidatus Pacearchaeota archaeon]
MTKISSLLGEPQKPRLSVKILTFREGEKIRQKLVEYENFGISKDPLLETEVFARSALELFKNSDREDYSFSVYQP